MSTALTTTVNTVSYTRKINAELRGGFKYESEEATLWVQYDPNDESPESAFARAKKAVLEQLGLPYTINGDGSITEDTGERATNVIKGKFPGATDATPTSGGGSSVAPQKQQVSPSPAPAAASNDRYAQAVAKVNADDGGSEFMASMKQKLAEGKTLTDNMVNAILKPKKG